MDNRIYETALAPGRSKLFAWLQLLRLPNLLTVPGDPIVGYLLAVSVNGAFAVEMFYCAAASLCLYCAGLVSNDIFDLREDRKDRPLRPVAAGLVSSGSVVVVAVVMAAAGIILAAWVSMQAGVIAAVLAAVALAYNAGAKKLPVIGPAMMGACRGLSLLIGAAAGGMDGLISPMPWGAALGLTAYIASVTSIARRETSPSPVGWRRNVPAIILAMPMVFFAIPWLSAQPDQPVLWLFCAMAAVVFLYSCWIAIVLGLDRGPGDVQRNVGRLIRLLMPIQAAAVLAAAAPWRGRILTAALLAGWGVSALLARRFYAS